MGRTLRLDKYLADTGLWSRKDARTLLKKGAVSVNGETERSAERKIDVELDTVKVNGSRVAWEEFHYILLYKPAGVLTATEDKRQKTVLDLLPERYRDLFPVGRLDKDTTGLLLLTDDGELAHRLLSPKYHVDKVYEAQIEGTVTGEDISVFEAGMVLGDGEQCLPAGLESLGEGTCLVTLREGKFHQVKRMLAARGKPVTALKRLSMGPLQLDTEMREGDWRVLQDEEIRQLRRE